MKNVIKDNTSNSMYSHCSVLAGLDLHWNYLSKNIRIYYVLKWFLIQWSKHLMVVHTDSRYDFSNTKYHAYINYMMHLESVCNLICIILFVTSQVHFLYKNHNSCNPPHFHHYLETFSAFQCLLVIMDFSKLHLEFMVYSATSWAKDDDLFSNNTNCEERNIIAQLTADLVYEPRHLRAKYTEVFFPLI